MPCRRYTAGHGTAWCWYIRLDGPPAGTAQLVLLLLLLLTLLYSVVCVTRRRVGRCMILSL